MFLQIAFLLPHKDCQYTILFFCLFYLHNNNGNNFGLMLIGYTVLMRT